MGRRVVWSLTDMITHALLQGRNPRSCTTDDEMSTTRGSRARSLWIAIAVLGGAAISGCGTAGVSGGTGTNAVSRIQVAQCMRANGVPNFPDGPITPNSGINPLSPAYKSAQNACRRYAPRYAPPPPTPASVVRQERALARCMRANGVPNFPDPDANGNIQFPIGNPIPQSPAFQRAQNGPCKQYMNDR